MYLGGWWGGGGGGGSVSVGAASHGRMVDLLASLNTVDIRRDAFCNVYILAIGSLQLRIAWK